MTTDSVIPPPQVWVPSPSSPHVHRVRTDVQVEGAITSCECGQFMRCVPDPYYAGFVWRPMRTRRALRTIRRYEKARG